MLFYYFLTSHLQQIGQHSLLPSESQHHWYFFPKQVTVGIGRPTIMISQMRIYYMHCCSDNTIENPLLSQWEETLHLSQPGDSILYCLYEIDQHVYLTSQGKDANVIAYIKFRALASIFCSKRQTVTPIEKKVMVQLLEAIPLETSYRVY